MPIEDRRYRLRRLGERRPSNRALWLRVALYAALLVVILVFQQMIGHSTASCLGVFAPSP